MYEKQFSENSFGFRPKRSAYDAMRKSQSNVVEGYKYVVDMDLEKYFDTVNQSKLVEVLVRTIKDGRVISLIHKYLTAKINFNISPPRKVLRLFFPFVIRKLLKKWVGGIELTETIVE
nr:reverse transcriptase domain-containing protein [Paenibacillus sp. Soil787]